MLFQAKASSFQSLRTKRYPGCNDGSRINAIRCRYIFDPHWNDVSEIRMAGNLIIAKFIGALAIRPAMMIVMAWTQIIRVREAISRIKKF